ncbi:MAG: hypothetical protein IKT99_06490, partial [Oscillospiraceae bacterium]|nr:hypothetical protein [Oscillospiraceae bacterium]
MKTSTRVLAWLISIVMLLGMFPGVTLAAEGEERVAGPVLVADPDSPTGYTGQFTYYDASAQQVYFCGDLNLSNYADQTDTKVYSPQEYKPGLMRRGGSQFKVAMQNLGDGWWYYELPLAAGANQYWFTIDNGRRMMPDPANHPYWSPNSNQSNKDAYNCIYVPYDEKQDNELLKAREVELPREGEDKGTWDYVPYTLNDRTFYMGVYLPYGYDAERAEPYKTIYLIHGFGQDESDWMGIGSAPNIMDNLIAEGRTEAAVLVALPNNNNSIGSQSDRFAALFNTVLPFVEENYNVSKDYMDRSVAGLSMGSRYSKYIMETDPLSFGYYGLFSCSETVKTETENIDKAHVFIGLGVYDGANYQNATTTNTQNMAEGFFEKTEYVAGAHDFNTWSQLFRIYAEDYLWKPWAFGDGEAPEEPEPGTEKGLVLKYDFKSLENGTIVEDVSGNGKAAEVMPRGSGVQTREVEIYGQPKTAIVIAGGTPSEGHNYVEMPVGVLNDLESVTISCWAYVNRTVSYGRIWDFGSNTTAYMYLLDAGGNTGHRGYTTALTASGWSNEIGPEKGSNLATRTWKLTTVTFDGATREISLYEDGEKIGTSVAAVGLDRLYGSTQNWIGYGQFKDNMFNGMIADFRIYDYAMSEAEVAAMFDIPDSDRVQRDYKSLSLGSTQNLEANLSLPTSGAAKSTIEWTS